MMSETRDDDREVAGRMAVDVMRDSRGQRIVIPGGSEADGRRLPSLVADRIEAAGRVTFAGIDLDQGERRHLGSVSWDADEKPILLVRDNHANVRFPKFVAEDDDADV